MATPSNVIKTFTIKRRGGGAYMRLKEMGTIKYPLSDKTSLLIFKLPAKWDKADWLVVENPNMVSDEEANQLWKEQGEKAFRDVRFGKSYRIYPDDFEPIDDISAEAFIGYNKSTKGKELALYELNEEEANASELSIVYRKALNLKCRTVKKAIIKPDEKYVLLRNKEAIDLINSGENYLTLAASGYRGDQFCYIIENPTKLTGATVRSIYINEGLAGLETHEDIGKIVKVTLKNFRIMSTVKKGDVGIPISHRQMLHNEVGELIAVPNELVRLSRTEKQKKLTLGDKFLFTDKAEVKSVPDKPMKYNRDHRLIDLGIELGEGFDNPMYVWYEKDGVEKAYLVNNIHGHKLVDILQLLKKRGPDFLESDEFGTMVEVKQSDLKVYKAKEVNDGSVDTFLGEISKVSEDDFESYIFNNMPIPLPRTIANISVQYPYLPEVRSRKERKQSRTNYANKQRRSTRNKD